MEVLDETLSLSADLPLLSYAWVFLDSSEKLLQRSEDFSVESHERFSEDSRRLGDSLRLKFLKLVAQRVGGFIKSRVFPSHLRALADKSFHPWRWVILVTTFVSASLPQKKSTVYREGIPKHVCYARWGTMFFLVQSSTLLQRVKEAWTVWAACFAGQG